MKVPLPSSFYPPLVTSLTPVRLINQASELSFEKHLPTYSMEYSQLYYPPTPTIAMMPPCSTLPFPFLSSSSSPPSPFTNYMRILSLRAFAHHGFSADLVPRTVPFLNEIGYIRVPSCVRRSIPDEECTHRDDEIVFLIG